ncbi:MAG: methyltransferase domain-containing protein [Haloarculaceae archaeon]
MPASDPGAAQQFYARWARLYDLLARAPGVRSWRTRATDALALGAGDTVVEMGCGTGANFPYLRERVGPGGRVVGIDLTPGMLGVARDRVARADWENVSVLAGDATRPPLRESVDAVVATFLVGMLEDPATAVEDWCDSLRPGGRLVLLNASRSPHPAAAPLNLLFRLFVRAAAPGGRTTAASPARALEGRVDAARDALAGRATSHEERRLGLGYVRLVSGRLPD